MPPNRAVHLISSGPLLNFYRADITLAHPVSGEWMVWPTVEHWFQSCKGLFIKSTTQPSNAKRREFEHYRVVEIIRTQPGPREAKAAGRNLEIYLPLWNRAAFGYMLAGHIAKFSQHADLRQILMQTGSKKLVEHRPDPLWGDNMDGTGKNLCGRSLMIVRRMSRDWS